MAYTGYEVAAGDVLRDIETLCRHLTDNGLFTTNTHPTLDTVERWITMSHHIIAAKLEAAGYSADQTDPEVLGLLEDLNALDVCIRIELSYPVTGTGEPNERYIEFKARRDELMKFIDGGRLEFIGAVKSRETGQFIRATGISVADKVALYSDPDLIHARFKRGQFTVPGTLEPKSADEHLTS